MGSAVSATTALSVAANPSETTAVASSPPSAPVTAISPSRFLNLPPELRNLVYDYVLSPSCDETDLLYASPPAESLFLTCRQIRREAFGYNTQSRLQYWRDTEFVVLVDDINYRQVRETIVKLRDEDLECITKMTFRHTHEQHTVTLLGRDQMWFMQRDTDKVPHGDISILYVIAKNPCQCMRPGAKACCKDGGTQGIMTSYVETAAEVRQALREPPSMKRQLLFWMDHFQDRESRRRELEIISKLRLNYM